VLSPFLAFDSFLFLRFLEGKRSQGMLAPPLCTFSAFSFFSGFFGDGGSTLGAEVCVFLKLCSTLPAIGQRLTTKLQSLAFKDIKTIL